MSEHDQVRRLAQALLAQPDEKACSACLDGLELYVAAQLRGEAYAAGLPAVAAHLDSCVACSESYVLLYGELAATGAPVLPARIPAPDLSFLPLPPQRSLDGGTALRAALERTATGLRLLLGAELLGQLPRLAEPSLAFRSGEADSPLLSLELAAPEDDVERLQLSVYPEAGDPDRFAVRVQLELRDREWPELAQIPVALAAGDVRRSGLTDPWGEVVFEGVAAALRGLVLEVNLSAEPLSR